MKLLPDSIRTRTIVVLLLGLTVSHLGSTLIYASDRDQALTAAGEQMLCDKLAVLAHIIEGSPAPVRRQVAEAISSPGLQVAWGPAEEMPAERVEDPRLPAIRNALRPHFGELDDASLLVAVLPSRHHHAAGLLTAAHLLHGLPSSDEQLAVSLSLRDASWINFRVALPDTAASWSLKSLLSTLVMVVATLFISIWATRWITAPLAAFARAAERLGVDVSAPPLPEDGPREVRAATRAFNQMQRRIRSFVEDRLQMLAAISHDLRTPITRLRLRTEQLDIDAGQQEKLLNDLDEMEQMVSSSLAFAKDEASGEPSQAMDLAALLGALCDEATDVGHSAEFAWDGRLIYRGRPLAMKRLFGNLIENAIRYGRSARVRATDRQGAVEVVVEDDGPGIPPDQLEAVFKPFYRLESSRNKRTGGIGLGLANARTIARAHGGDVTLQNRPEGGLSAIVTLPTGADPISRSEGGAR